MTADAFGRTAAPRDLIWPGGRRIAVVFNVAFETWSPDATSGVGPMGNLLAGGLFDPNADSYGRYNEARGSERLIDIAARNGVAASVMTSSRIAEFSSPRVKRLFDAGHDIVAHGYTQDQVMPTLAPEQREEAIIRSLDLLTRATTCRPRGWISPRVTSGVDTQRLFAKHGVAWHGDALDDDLPYLQHFPEGDILAIPMSVEFNDLPHAMRFGRTPGQFVELFREALDGLRKQPGETIILDVFIHGHCYGRPAGAWAFDEIVKRAVDDPSIWVTTRRDIYSRCAEAMGLKSAALLAPTDL